MKDALTGRELLTCPRHHGVLVAEIVATERGIIYLCPVDRGGSVLRSSSGSELARRRIALGLTQKALARACGPGVTHAAVCEVEHGAAPGRHPTAARLVPVKLTELEAAQ